MDEYLTINKKVIASDISPEGFRALFPEFICTMQNTSLESTRYAADACVFGEREFSADVYFSQGYLKEVRLSPKPEEDREPGCPDRYRRVCDECLLELYGEPQERNQNITYYEYEWGSISTEYGKDNTPDCSILIDYQM